MEKNSAQQFLTEYMAKSTYQDLNDMSQERLDRILTSLRGLDDIAVNQTQIQIEILIQKLQTEWDLVAQQQSEKMNSSK